MINVLIERDFQFLAAIYFQGEFQFNVYDLTLHMEVNTESVREQHVAIERVKYFILNCLDSCIFINESEKNLIEKYEDCGLKVCALSDDPYDQIVALIILAKSEAITEGRMEITDVLLTSRLSDGVKFKESIESVKSDLIGRGWWSEASPMIVSQTKLQNKKEKIVKLIHNDNDWNEFDLGWKEKNNSTPEIIFTPEK